MRLTKLSNFRFVDHPFTTPGTKADTTFFRLAKLSYLHRQA
jgi:hypothetical protein